MSLLDDLAIADIAPTVYDVIKLANPAAGVDFSFVVPGQQIWEVQTVTGVLTTSAAVANRRAQIVVDDQTTTVGQFPSTTAVVASSIRSAW